MKMTWFAAHTAPLFITAVLILSGLSTFAEEKKLKRGDVILPMDFSKESDRSKWKLEDFGAWVPEGKNGKTVLKVTVPADKSAGHQKASHILDLTPFKGMKLFFQCEVKAQDVSKPPQPYNGVKFMVHYKSAATGDHWVNENNVYGTFDWKTLSASFTVPPDILNADYALGLESSTGTVWFDNPRVTIQSAELPVRPKPMANAPPAFTGREGIPRLRGVMSPNVFKEDDFKTLASWNVNLIRWQINRNFGTAGTELDLEEYDKWIDSKMVELDNALKAAQIHGIKILIDLHMPPGGRLKDMSHRMYYEKKYQDHFVKVWETFAKRYKGHPAVWGYDLINEPVENTPAAQGMGFLETQIRAAKAVRAIDSQTPIVIESEAFDSPDAFSSLLPIDMPRVIYQVHMYMPGEFTHQGVYNKVTNIRYPGTISGRHWDKEALRKALQPVREFQLAYNVHIYAGEFSAVRWAPGADQYLRDCIEIFEEYGWDWSYHAYGEWPGWSVEYEDLPADRDKHVKATTDTARKKVLLEYFSKNVRTGASPTSASPPTAASSSSPTASGVIFEDLLDDETSKKWQPVTYQYKAGKNGKALAIRSEDPTKIINTAVLLPMDPIKGKKINVSAFVKADKVGAKPKPYNGIKMMLVVTGADGKKEYPQAPIEVGTFDWTKASLSYPVPEQAVSVQLILGLEVVSGEVLFDEVRVSLEK